MAHRSLLSEIADDDVPQVPRLRLITARRAKPDLDPYDDTVPPPVRARRLDGSTRIMLCGFLVVAGFLAGVAAQKHHDAGYLSPDAVSRALISANVTHQIPDPPTSQVAHTNVPSPQ
jgi:hypothetical protein